MANDRIAPDDIRNMFRHDCLSQRQNHYLVQQAGRLAHVLNTIQDIILANDGMRIRVLDVAPHLLTTAIRRHFGHRIELATLGWFDESLISRADVDEHYEFDLNDTNFRDKWIIMGQNDVIIMGEIFEHLFACPRMTLSGACQQF